MNAIKLSLVLLATLSIASLSAKEEQVQVKTFNKILPTYHMGPDQSMPYLKDFNVPGLRFFRGSRSVYPYTFQNDYKPGKSDKEYEVVRLENEFIYVDIIPSLRGRIQGAVDKRNGWDFLYYNHVIKPAEISVRSAWISGGLEHNHPRGHGYTQFNNISYDIIDCEDGGKTIVIAEVEPVRMMKWEFEITLRPGQLYLETKGRFISTAPFPVPFLSSNNAAMHTTEKMKVIMPQETHASNHGFSSMKKWPYYGNDDADWNWYKNMTRQSSAFVDGTGLMLDYWGVYSHEEEIDAGTVIVADHRVSPGKKFFTWGSHPDGRQWDHFLSDEDGGYVELQQQAYYANLGYGYAVLDPFEVKEFSIFWYPIKNTAGFVKATKDVAVNFDRKDDHTIKLSIQPTSEFLNSTVELVRNNKKIKSIPMDLKVGDVINQEFDLDSSPSDTITVRILSDDQYELISYSNNMEEIEPEINKLPRLDDEKRSIDQLYFKAISDFHDPLGIDAEDGFNKILDRDPQESRANRQMGIIAIKRGQYETAINYLKKSLMNDHFESSYETHFLLGYAYLKLDDLISAHKHLVQSSRKKDKLDISLYYLAQAQVLKGNYQEAIRYLEEIPISRLTHPDVYNLKTYVYTQTGDIEKANENIENAYRIDPLNFFALVEQLELVQDQKPLIKRINFLFDRQDKTFIGSQLYLETAHFYIELKDFDKALNVLSIAQDHYKPTGTCYPFVDYYIGYCYQRLGKTDLALEHYKTASQTDSTYVFPYRTTTLDVLENVIKLQPKDAVANMYHGDLLYYLRRHKEAISAWKRSYKLDKTNAQVARNLGLAYFVETKDTDKTVQLLEVSFRNSNKNQRVFSELEQIYKLRKNLKKLEKHYDQNWDVVKSKGDFALNCADLYLREGRHEDALKVIEDTYFNAIERSPGQPIRHIRYAEAHTGMGEDALSEGNYEKAITHFLKALEYPEYLNEIKVENPVTVRLDYLLGLAYELNNQQADAKKSFQKAINQKSNPISVAVIYRAQALEEVGKEKEGKKLVQEFLKTLEKSNKRHHAEDEYGHRRHGGVAFRNYLKSLAYGYLGDHHNEKKFRDLAFDADIDVVMKARFQSSFIRKQWR